MNVPTLSFGRGYSLAKIARAQSRYAAALRYLLDHPGKTTEVNGNLQAALARHDLMTSVYPRTVTSKGRTWLDAYTGPVAPLSDILVSHVTNGRKRPGRYRYTPSTMLATMAEHPELWLFIHRPALDKLPPCPFWLLTWLGAHRDVRTVDGIASAVGWSMDAVRIALRAIRDAGYTVEVAGESAAD